MRTACFLSNHVKLLFLVDIVGNIWVGKWVRSFMVIIRLITVHYSLTNSIISTLTLCRSHDANLCHDLWKDKLLRCWWWNINTHPLRLRWFPESLCDVSGSGCLWQLAGPAQARCASVTTPTLRARTPTLRAHAPNIHRYWCNISTSWKQSNETAAIVSSPTSWPMTWLISNLIRLCQA